MSRMFFAIAEKVALRPAKSRIGTLRLRRKPRRAFFLLTHVKTLRRSVEKPAGFTAEHTPCPRIVKGRAGECRIGAGGRTSAILFYLGAWRGSRPWYLFDRPKLRAFACRPRGGAAPLPPPRLWFGNLASPSMGRSFFEKRKTPYPVWAEGVFLLFLEARFISESPIRVI